MKRRTITGRVELIRENMEASCGGAAAGRISKTQDVSMENMRLKMKD
jgi:hypothetical protein